MTEYHATATRDGDLWVVHIPWIGTTQGIDRDDATRMARDYIAVLHDIPIEDVTVSITWREPMSPEQLAELEKDHARLREDLAKIYGWAREHLGLDRDASTLDVVSLLKRFEHDSEAYRDLLESANPDLTAAVERAITLNINAGSSAIGTARAAVTAMFRHYETAYVDENHQGSNLLGLYIEPWQEFNLLNARRCLRYACDHLETHHTDSGCERCPCPELTRTPTR